MESTTVDALLNSLREGLFLKYPQLHEEREAIRRLRALDLPTTEVKAAVLDRANQRVHEFFAEIEALETNYPTP